MTNRRDLAGVLVGRFGGRFSVELGLDVDRRPADVERWFLAATLFGTRISTTIAMRTFRTLGAGGVHTVADAGRRSWDDLVVMLDEGGYARYDFRTATRLQQLAAALGASAAAAGLDARDLEAALVRLALRHRNRDACPGGSRCIELAAPDEIAKDGRRSKKKVTFGPGRRSSRSRR